MKKKLLFLGTLMLSSIGAFAQGWVAPELQVETANLEDVVGQKVFLYNKEAGGFLRGLGEDSSPHWGSRAGVAAAGIDTVIIQPAIASSVKEGTSETGNTVWDTEWDGQTYILQNYASHITSPRWDEVWFGLMDYVTIWTDRQNSVTGNENFFWNIEKNADGTYAIKTSPKSTWLADIDLYASLIVKDQAGNDSIVPAIKGGERLGVDLANADLVLCFEGYNDGAALAYNWSIVTVAAYEATDLEAFNAEVARYNAAISLKAAIDDAKAKYEGIVLTTAEAAYANTASTLEELEAAKAVVTQAIMDYQEQQATPDNPSDMSDVIENATFDVVGDFTGWKGTAFGAGGTTSTCAELYDASSFHTYQDIVGLPKGVYAVSVKGFYRAGSISNDWNTRNDASVRNARLFAVSGTDSLTTAIPSLSAAATPESTYGGSATGDNNELYVPNTMYDFTLFKEAGLIKDVTVLVPVLNDSLRLGVVKTAHISTDWCIVDDFTLKYYGNSLAAYELWKNMVLASVPTKEELIASDEVLYTEAYLTAYEEAIAAAKNETNPDNMSAVIAAIDPAVQALAANVKAYQAWLDKAAAVLAELDANEGIEGDSVDYLAYYFMDNSEPGGEYPNGGYEYIYDEHNLTNEQLEAEVHNLDQWLTAAIKHGLKEGGDCTSMLVNPSFADGFTGWTNSEGGSVVGNVGGKSFLPNVEVYQNVVDIVQVVTEVPAGIYSISVQAFERPAGNGSFDGTEESTTFIFMNEFQTPVMNIVADAMPAADAQDQVNCLVGDGGGAWPNDYDQNGEWIPNSMDGASYAFQAKSVKFTDEDGNPLPRYENRCYGIVGDDGVMKIGLTSNGASIPEWLIWANFKLTYEGKNEAAISSILEATVAQAQAYLDEKSGEMTSPASGALNDAIAAAEEAEGYEGMNAALSAVNAALSAAKENVEAYAALTAAADALYAAVSEYGDAASAEAIDMFNVAVAKVDEAADLTTEELIALTEECNAATAALKIPATDGVSDENPLDMTSLIINADFANGAADGSWTVVKSGIQNGPAWGGGGRADNGFEFWNGDATTMEFDINQTLLSLPAGKYALGADVANSINGATLGTNGGRAYLYATVLVGEETKTYSTEIVPQTEDCDVVLNTWEVIFDVPADAKVIVGVKTVGTQDAKWFAGDNFTLTYFGTESAKENSGDPTGIEGVEDANKVVPVAIYSVSGARVATPVKGINIVKMSDGTVKKVFVK